MLLVPTTYFDVPSIQCPTLEASFSFYLESMPPCMYRSPEKILVQLIASDLHVICYQARALATLKTSRIHTVRLLIFARTTHFFSMWTHSSHTSTACILTHVGGGAAGARRSAVKMSTCRMQKMCSSASGRAFGNGITAVRQKASRLRLYRGYCAPQAGWGACCPPLIRSSKEL